MRQLKYDSSTNTLIRRYWKSKEVFLRSLNKQWERQNYDPILQTGV